MTWLTQANPCDTAVRILGESQHRYRVLADKIAHMGYRLFGERLTARETLMRLSQRIRLGGIYVYGDDICVGRRCVNYKEFFEAIEEYYDAYRDRLRALRDIEFYCDGNKPSVCREEVEKYLERIKELWDIPINPKKVMKDLRMLAITKDPKFPEALEIVGSFMRARRRLIRCAEEAIS